MRSQGTMREWDGMDKRESIFQTWEANLKLTIGIFLQALS